MLELSSTQRIVIWILPVLFALTIHEASHAYMAYRYGDTTAKMLGRLSFNPAKHIDLIGTIFVPILTLLLTNFSFFFGWAKPVPINTLALKNPRKELAIITAAGPISNLLMAFLWALVLKIGLMLHPMQSNFALFLSLSGQAGMVINLVFAFLNLIPIPPLDGSRILSSLLPLKQALSYQKIEPYGIPLIFILLFTGVIGWILGPLISLSLVIFRSFLNL